MTDPVSTERLEQMLAGERENLAYLHDNDWGMGHIRDCENRISVLTELLAARQQAPAEWQDGFVAEYEVTNAVEAYRHSYPDGSSRAGQQGMRAALEGFAYRRAVSSRQAPEGVRVKPLEWEEDEPGWWCAQPAAMLGGLCYEARVTDSGKVRSRSGMYDWAPFDGTLEQAKAAAQADYEARILSAIEPVTQTVSEEVAPDIHELRNMCAASQFHDHDGCACTEPELRTRFSLKGASHDQP